MGMNFRFLRVRNIHTLFKSPYLQMPKLPPKEVDWTSNGIAGDIEDQGCSRTCCIIATLCSIECLLRIQCGVNLRFSRDYLMDIMSRTPYGITTERTFMMLQLHGVPLESDMKGPRFCIWHFQRLPCYNGDHKPIPYEDKKYANHDSLLTFQSRVALQPVVAGVQSREWCYWQDDGEVHRSESDMIRFDHKIDHATLIVGYGTQDGENYWLVKNAYGEDFGTLGYIKIIRGINDFGIEQWGYYPIIDSIQVKKWMEKVGNTDKDFGTMACYVNEYGSLQQDTSKEEVFKETDLQMNKKIASFILEMWLNWHESLWVCVPDFVKNFSKIEGFGPISVALPHMLIQPVSASTVLHIMQSTHAIKEFWVQCLKRRVCMSNLWHCTHHGKYLPNFLLSAARFLFQQIIYAHRKSFDADQFAAIKYNFSSFEKEKSMATDESIRLVSTLVASSRHNRLKNSVQKFIVPLLRELYLQSSTAAEITLLENNIITYKFVQDLHFFVTAGDDENELILASVLQGFYDAVTLLLRNNVDKSEALENLDLILLCLDEIVDGGIILETNGPLIAEKVTSHSMDADAPLSEQTLTQA